MVDGVTVGHPCCSIHNCMTPLQRSQDRFCPLHQNEANKCVITTCTNPASRSYKTCANPECRSIEERINLRNKAMFRLKNTLHHQQRQAAEDGLAEVEIDNEGDEPDAGIEQATRQNTNGGTKRKGRFTRRWTHNEELCVASCGIILGRATFFGSEAPSGVKA